MSGAGNLFFKVSLWKRGNTPDGLGGKNSAFAKQFETRAEFVHMRGGEAVVAARLAGKHLQIVKIRANSRSRQILNTWQLKDERKGTIFNVRDITPTMDRQFLELLCESGVA